VKAIRSIDLVIPVYNEEDNLPRLLDQLHKDLGPISLDWRVLFVDDGSSDRSFQILERAAKDEPRFHVIQLARNFGQHAAIFAGFSRCEADAVVTLDADLQNPPAEIPRLVQALDEGYDVAGGWRRDRNDSAFRRFASLLMNRLVSAATGVSLRDYGCMLRAYRIEVVRRMRESGETSSFIPALAHCFTDRITEVRVDHSERAVGGSRYTVFGLISLLLDLLTGFSMTPLRVLSVLGFGTALLGTAFGVFLVVMRLTLGSGWAAEGVFTLFAPLFVFIGAQFIALGLLGEYIGRIYNEVRRRPQFAVRTEIGGERKGAMEVGADAAARSTEGPARGRVP
jgi:undecaprenyl-phosphate 4-deoxy-4-formamido-L-arabinose transferase